MNIEPSYVEVMNKGIKNLTEEALRISLKKPSFAKFILKYLAWQSKAEKIRAHWHQEGIRIPPFLIASITNHCNLGCKGCYDIANQKHHIGELSQERWLEVFQEAKELGISFILIGGGEPFLRCSLLSGAGNIPEIIFPIFTNGTLIDADALHTLEKSRNLIPILSLEGYEAETDARRGKGIYQQVTEAMLTLHKKSLFFGNSVTVTTENFHQVISDAFVSHLLDRGSKIIFYIEYVPFDPATKHLEITQQQRVTLEARLKTLRSTFPALFISFPGDESKMGGCLSSGRGFAHISASGALEPCPFSPYSDVNLSSIPLKEALQSKFLKDIRESNEDLTELENGCALFNKKDWVLSILNQ